MAFFNALLLLAATAAIALAEEGTRSKKDILLTTGLASLGDDGSWFPGKYDPTILPATAAIRTGLPISSYSAGLPISSFSAGLPITSYAHSGLPISSYSAYPSVLPYGYSGLYRSPYML